MTILEQLSSTAAHLAGTWRIDPVHSEVSFTVRHLMNVFGDFGGGH